MLPSGLPEYVSDKESLARFLNSSSLFNAAGRVKPAAFMPRNGETSVFRYPENIDDDLWNTGKEILPPHRQLYGAAFIKAGDIRLAGLNVIAKEPPHRHANIMNWPMDNDKSMEKARQKELSIQLTQNAMFRKKH